jgi:hypothetical protein
MPVPSGCGGKLCCWSAKALVLVATIVPTSVVCAGKVSIRVSGAEETEQADGPNIDLSVSSGLILGPATSADVRSWFDVQRNSLGIQVSGGIGADSHAENSDTVGSGLPTAAAANHSFSEEFELEHDSVATIWHSARYGVSGSQEYNTASASGSVTIKGPEGFNRTLSFDKSVTGDQFLEDGDGHFEPTVILPAGKYTFDFKADTAATGKSDFDYYYTGGGHANAGSSVLAELDAQYLGAKWSSDLSLHAIDDESSFHFQGAVPDGPQTFVPYGIPNFEGKFDYDVKNEEGSFKVEAKGHMSGRFKNGQWALGGKYDLKLTPGEGTTVAHILANTSVEDRVFIRGNLDVEVPYDLMTVRGYIDGSYVASLLDATQMADLRIGLKAISDYAQFVYSTGYTGDPSTITPQFHRFELDIPLDDRAAELFLRLELEGRFQTKQATLGVTVDLSNTVVIDGITFPDGSTPESHGYQLILGSGLLSPNVSGPALAGDFNVDGVVDAADYVVWRNGVGTIYTHADYDLWRAHFGLTAAALDVSLSSELAARVPEPASAVLLLGCVITLLGAPNRGFAKVRHLGRRPVAEKSGRPAS